MCNRQSSPNFGLKRKISLTDHASIYFCYFNISFKNSHHIQKKNLKGIGVFSKKKAQKRVSQNIIQFLLDIKCFEMRERNLSSYLIQLKLSLCFMQNALLIKLKTLYLS